MRKFLSFTTALVSFMALGGASSFAADMKSAAANADSTQDSSVVAMENSVVVMEKQRGSSDSKASKKPAHHRAATSKNHKAQAASKGQKKATPAAAHQAAGAKGGPVCPKKGTVKPAVMMDDGRPKIFLGGVVEAFYHYASQEDGYDKGSAFYNIGNLDGSKRVVNLGPALPGGSVYDPDHYTPSNFRDYSKSWGAEAKASLQFKIQGQNTDTGIMYGAVAEVSLKGVGSITGGPSPFHTNGTYLFASSNYGTLSMGYQEGPETSMRIDASNISVGDMGLGNDWYKYANVEGKDGTVPFLVAPGLYTEGFLAGTNSMGQQVNRLNSVLGFDDVDTAMPFRFSYSSPLFAGFKFGVSYAPHYDSKGFTHDYSGGFAQLSHGTPIELMTPYPSSIAPSYKNIVSGGVSYQYMMSDIDMAVAAVGEFGSAITHDDDLAAGRLYNLFIEGRDLRSFGVGAKVGYAGLELAASFATLNKSGTIESIYGISPMGPTIPTQNNMEMVSVSTVDCGASCLYEKDESTNYFTLGAGYKYQDAYVSATFFRSKAYDKNELRHFALGAQYNLAYGRTVFAPYVSWNYFWTEQVDALNTGTPPAGTRAEDLNGFQYHTSDNKGSVLLAGVRFLFS